MTRALLSLGGNLGDRLAHLRAAVVMLGPGVVRVSGVYETPPWGDSTQPSYLNAVVLMDDPTATPRDWLARARACEAAGGRVRDPDRRFGPRTLDVDVIAVWAAAAPQVTGGVAAATGEPEMPETADGVAAAAAEPEAAGGRDGAAGGSDPVAGGDETAVGGTRATSGEPVFDDDPELTLPHPRAHLRAFVLVPWHAMCPDAELPGHGPIAALLDTPEVAADVAGVSLRPELSLESME